MHKDLINRSTKRSLAVFAKAPISGHVKTRLQAHVGEQRALDVHIDLVTQTLRRLAGNDSYSISLWTTQSHPQCTAWAAEFSMSLHFQTGDNLGQRMANCFEHLLKPESSEPRVLLVGTDCPLIDADYVNNCFAALDDHEVVIGPAEDGGYGLIGMTQINRSLFNDIDWGTSQVLAQTFLRAEYAGLTVSEQPVIWDVDEIEDLQRYERMRN